MTLVTVRKYLSNIDGLDKGLILFFVFGAIVTLVSLFRGILVDRQVQVEYVNGIENAVQKNIFVDIEGSVMNPGVYELVVGSRIKDVLAMAGGLSFSADRDYCEKNINLAELLKDGEKIYVPSTALYPTGGGYVQEGNEAKKVNVNTASSAELDTLVGVGSARSESIVKNRPYKNLDELVSKGGMTKSIFDKNKEKLTVF